MAIDLSQNELNSELQQSMRLYDAPDRTAINASDGVPLQEFVAFLGSFSILVHTVGGSNPAGIYVY